jgi:RTX calcium-binding nonapeptide repeat (4 copies)
MGTSQQPMLRLYLWAPLLLPFAVAGFLLLAGAFPGAAEGLPASASAACRSAHSAAQWKARCAHVGRRGITVIGRRGRNVLRGSSRNDAIFAGTGPHTVYAKAGNDRVAAGAGPDRIFTGPGNDLVMARNGKRDVINCGGGHNIVLADRSDRIHRCAVVIWGSSQQGTKAHPIPLRRSGQLGDGWRLRIVESTPDATKRVIQAGKGQNSPPPPGHQFFLVKVSATRTDRSSARFRAGFRLRATPGPTSKRPYATYTDPCGILPDPDLEIVNPKAHRGQTVSGYICWDVWKRQAKRLVMFNAGGIAGGTKVYFALHS